MCLVCLMVTNSSLFFGYLQMGDILCHVLIAFLLQASIRLEHVILIRSTWQHSVALSLNV